ncbi:hypothetical protein A2526_00945 [candidate division WOR-1 bacterium RIFOXYD2_FULL_36_8]|uniref:Uncharacterized protein n=1 Tax=candidate division WOR-1 bacterium RIFOXYB2_FULL_36_35 TaxID=1802578 RepID=A0A1F4S2A9_UNCSA|nr:MAG: hypothetical protein A2230_06185 [candidate division WOR-1 bacterium RIFOXYA2_FULL_36_21]OGC14561.1 MAG: hypothetical protein A2290_01775 [candidate division WOR-1 bacterium RIFOXYB2_FULL_36_35]OGC16233.1 MAG: hypothetical protein A2282_01330 [candidate division WOR-1 bacterium RIFOXYA12_FULL_36_13]OGC38698.1 MAG: hypothetical protein A2526_00945 [candidate division WOR-1 bacterium RIFOXYD2_FULL_36_8]
MSNNDERETWSQLFNNASDALDFFINRNKVLYPESFAVNYELYDFYRANSEFLKAKEFLAKAFKYFPREENNMEIVDRMSLQLEYFLAIAQSSEFTGKGFSFDSLPVETIPYDNFNPNEATTKPSLGSELSIFTNPYGVTNYDYYYLSDENTFNVNIKSIASQLGCTEIQSLTPKQALELAAQITMSLLRFQDKTDKIDRPDKPLEERIKEGGGVCRNYITLFKAVFTEIKKANGKMENLFLGYLQNHNHVWSVVLEVRQDKIVATQIDITAADEASPLEALDRHHFGFEGAGHEKSASEILLDEGLALLDKGKDMKALIKFNDIQYHFPNSKEAIEALLILTRLYLRLNDPRNTIKTLQKLDARKSELSNLQLRTLNEYKAVIELKKHNLPEALKYFDLQLKLAFPWERDVILIIQAGILMDFNLFTEAQSKLDMVNKENCSERVLEKYNFIESSLRPK